MTVSVGLRLFAVGLLVVAAVFFVLFLKERKIARLKIDGAQTSATITNAVTEAGGTRYREGADGRRESYYEHPKYWISYTFTVNQVPYNNRKDLGLRGFLNFQKGAQLPVWYDASNPSFHSLDPSMNYSNLYLTLCIVGLSLGAVTLIFSFRTGLVQDEPMY